MFSVVIPLFNKAAYLTRALDSVAAQGVRPAEIIVVNDGSTDGGDAVAREAAAHSPIPLRVLDQPNRGVSAARNAGIAAATQPFVAFLDADDCWLPEFLARMKSLIEAHPGAVLYGSGFTTVRHGSPKKRHAIRAEEIVRPGPGVGRDVAGEVDFFRASSRDIVTNSSSIVVPRSVVAAHGGFPEGVPYMEDWMFWARLALAGPVVLTAEPLAEYDVTVPGQAIEYWRRDYTARFDVLAYHRFLADELRRRTATGQAVTPDDSFASYARLQLRTAALQRLYWGRFDALRTLWHELRLDGLRLGPGGDVCGWVVRHPRADGIVGATMVVARTVRQTVLRRFTGTMIIHRLRQLRRLFKWRHQVRQSVATQLQMLENPDGFVLGTLTAADEARLVELVHRAAAHPGPIVEIGTLFGLTTRVIVAAAGPGQAVVTVDNFCWNPFGITPAMHEQFARCVLRAELAAGRLTLEQSDSAAFRAGYRGPTPALVFLDADHSYAPVRDEIAWARGLGVPIICGHDYGEPKFGVTRAVDEAFGPGGVTVSGTVWSWERPA